MIAVISEAGVRRPRGIWTEGGLKSEDWLSTPLPPSAPPLPQNCVDSTSPPAAPPHPALEHSVSQQSAEQVTVFLIQINDPIQPCLLSRKLESVGRSK